MAEIKVPIQVNLPDDWMEQIVNRLRNDPDAEWAEIVRCKDCKKNPHWEQVGCPMTGRNTRKPNDFCSYAERKDGEKE